MREPIEQTAGKALDGRARIAALEAAMFALPDHQVELKPEHYFADGVYVRALRIPKGVALVGKIHKTEHLCILAQGRIAVATEDGERVLEAPQIIVSPAGSKRAGYALEDSLWINVHPTDERDLEKIEQRFIAQSYEEFLEHARGGALPSMEAA